MRSPARAGRVLHVYSEISFSCLGGKGWPFRTVHCSTIIHAPFQEMPCQRPSGSLRWGTLAEAQARSMPADRPPRGGITAPSTQPLSSPENRAHRTD